jgi:hypothetical protein
VLRGLFQRERALLGLPSQTANGSILKTFQTMLGRTDVYPGFVLRRRRLVNYLRALRKMRHSLPSHDKLMMRIGAAKSKAGRAASYVQINLPAKNEPVTRKTFSFKLDREKFDKAELQDGHYLLRSNVTGGDPVELWERYVQLTEIEAVFKTLKSDLRVRPVYHQLEHRVDAHIFIAFLAYSARGTLKKRLQVHAPGLTPKAVLEKLATIQIGGCMAADYR